MPKGPKLPHAQPPIQLASGRWQGRVRYYDEAGKRHEQTQTFTTQRAANAWSRDREQWLLHHPHAKEDKNEAFGPFLDDWLHAHAAQTRDTTAEGYAYAARHAKAALGDRPLRDLTPMDFQRLYQSLGDGGLAPSTIRQVHVVCRQALAVAVDYEMIVANPTLKAKPPRVTQPPITPPTPEQAKAFLRVANNHRLKALWYFLALSGCRRGEAIGLRWADIDWEQKIATIRVIQVGKATKRREHDPKTTHSRRAVGLSDFLIDVLREHQQEQRIVWQSDHPGQTQPPWVFTTQNGTWLAGDNVRKTFKILLGRAGLPESFRIHDLRHAMATVWLGQGVSPKVVSERLGHASIAITLQLYAHAMPGMQHEAANRLDAWIAGTDDDDDEDNGDPDTDGPMN